MNLDPLLLIGLGGAAIVFLLVLMALIALRRRSAAKRVQKSKPKKKKAVPRPVKRVAKASSADDSSRGESVPPVPPPPPPAKRDYKLGDGEKIRILVVDDNPDTRDHVSRLLYFEKDMEVIGQAINGRQGVEMAVAHKPHIVLMDINMPDMDGIEATHKMSVDAAFSQVIIMTVQSEQHYMKKAMAAGARDFQPKPFTSEELVSCVRRVYNIGKPFYSQFEAAEQTKAESRAKTPTPDDATSTGDQSIAVAVFSPKGGIGTTTIATNLAVALQQAYGDVVFMDAALQFGDSLVHLNTRPTRSIGDLVHQDELDVELLSDVLLAHNSGIKLLLAPPQPETADAILSEMLPQIIRALKRRFKVVVIDTYSKLDNKMLAVLESVDYLLCITNPELPGIKSAKQFLRLADDLEYPADRLDIVINRSDRPGGVPARKIEKILKLTHTFHLPDDPRMPLAINRGIIVVQQSSTLPFAQAIIELAEAIGEKFPQVKEMAPLTTSAE